MSDNEEVVGWVHADDYNAVCDELTQLKEVVGGLTEGNKRITNMYRNKRRRVTRLIEECRVLYAERRETRRVLRTIMQLGGPSSTFMGSAEGEIAFIKELVSEFYKRTTRPLKPSVFVVVDDEDAIQQSQELQ